ncbi:hypothetical protein GE09DRAFT_1216121 [Coniochaeta sp. 2T2.1]|nr:hypothetical protein GE09DRAFT_1216121 [Coniochaeta sp. 2T2.1]
MAWTEYIAGATVTNDELEDLFARIYKAADILFTTTGPLRTDLQSSRYTLHNHWMRPAALWPSVECQATADVIAIDAAANMNRADLCSIWGNTLRPILLAGDPLQLTLTAMEQASVDIDKTALNRLANDGSYSGYLFQFESQFLSRYPQSSAQYRQSTAQLQPSSDQSSVCSIFRSLFSILVFTFTFYSQ